MDRVYPYDLFLSLTGLERDRTLLETSESVRHSVVTTDKDEGVMRALHLDIQRSADEPLAFQIEGYYLLHGVSEDNVPVKILDVQTRNLDGNVALKSVEVMGQKLELTEKNGFAVNESISALVDSIAHDHEWINFVELFERHEIAPSAFGRAALPGLYADGSLKTMPAHVSDSEQIYQPVFPAFLLPAIIGCGPEHYTGVKESSRSLPFKDPATNETMLLRHTYNEGKSRMNMDVTCELVSHSPEGIQTYPIYKVTTKPEKDGDVESARIASLEFYHPNAANGEPEKVDLSNPREVAVACKTMRMISRSIRAGAQEFKHDTTKKPQDRRLFLPSNIMLQSGLTDVMARKTPAPKRGGRLEVRPLGGQGTRKIFSGRDEGIGGNSYEITYIPPGETEGKTILEDAGTLFHDEFDDVIINLGKYLPHKYNKNHVPERDVEAIVLSHGHKDHYGGLGYLARAYELPVLVMKASTFEKVKRDLDGVNLDPKIKAEVLDKCMIIEPSKDININKPGETETVEIGGTKITKGTEVIPGENLGQSYYYPTLQIADFTLRLCDMPHSDPELIVDFVTPAGTYRHTGDYKLDQSYQNNIGPYEPWLKAHHPDIIGADSTGALKAPDERTVTEIEIEHDLVTLLRDHQDERVFTSIIGSNITRFQTLVRTMGQVGRENLLVDGKALNDMVRDQDKINDLIGWAKREHGVNIVKQSQKKEVARVLEEEPKSNQIILLTGTQDEPYSSVNRGLRDWLPDGRPSFFKGDVMMMLQGAIPVDNNYMRRAGAAFYAQHVFGMTMVLPEIVEKEAGLKIAGSGHASPADMKELYQMSGLPFLIPIHGSKEQLEANLEHGRAVGADGMVIHNGEAVVKEQGKPPRRGIRDIIEVVGLKSNAPPEQFWNRSNVSATVVPLKPVDDSSAGVALSKFERMALGHDPEKVDFEAVEPLALALSRSFNMAITGGFLSANYPFGVEKYGSDVYKEKRIGAYAAADTETTGTDPIDDFMTQFAMVEWTLGKKKRHETVLHQEVPEYHTGSPEAYLVTNTSPEETRQGLSPILFADRINTTVKAAKSRSKENFQRQNPEDTNTRKRVKTLVVWHNAKFDDKFVRKTLGDGLFDRVRPHSTDGVISMDTRNIARAVHAAMPDAIKVRRNEETGFLDFTLQALCEENGISYDERKAHKYPKYDAERAMYLFWKMEKAAPEIVSQMILNADFSTRHLLNDMRGVDTGFGQDAPYPVFSYMSPSARNEDLKIGCLLGTVGGRFAVVADLSKDPQDLLDKPVHELEKIVRDFHDDRLEIIDLRQNPMALSPKHYFRQNTGKRKPQKELLDRRASVVKAHLNFRDPKRGWENIADRLTMLYTDNAALFFARSSLENPDLHQDLPTQNLPHMTHPHDTSIHVLKMRATSSFNIVTQKLLPKVKAYREAAVAFHDSEEADQPEAKEAAITAYRDLITASGFDNSRALQIHLTQYGIAPESIDAADRDKVENYIQYQGLRMLIRADEAMQRIKDDPDKMQKFVGRSHKKLRLLSEIQFDLDSQRERFESGDIRVRQHAHPWWESYDNDDATGGDPDLAA